jgi:hypothetical protein
MLGLNFTVTLSFVNFDWNFKESGSGTCSENHVPGQNAA